MSIFNAVLIDDFRACLIGVDSEVVDLANPGRRPSTTKLWYLPHARCVVAGRGHVGFLASVGVGVTNPFTIDDVDDIAAMLASVFAAVKAQPAVEIDERQELVFCGWSPTLRRMRLWQFTQSDAADSFKASESPGVVISPWEVDLGRPPCPDSEPAMIVLADIQHDLLWSRCRGDAAGGGELVIARLTQDSCTMRIAHSWPD